LNFPISVWLAQWWVNFEFFRTRFWYCRFKSCLNSICDCWLVSCAWVGIKSSSRYTIGCWHPPMVSFFHHGVSEHKTAISTVPRQESLRNVPTTQFDVSGTQTCEFPKWKLT
jgi:hypothetical protein